MQDTLQYFVLHLISNRYVKLSTFFIQNYLSKTITRSNIKLLDLWKGWSNLRTCILYSWKPDYRCSCGSLLITAQHLEDRLNECPRVKRSAFISNLKNVLSLSAAVKNSLNPLPVSTLFSHPRSASILLYGGNRMEADSLPGINYARLSRITLSLGTPFHLTRILNLNHFLTIFLSVASIRDLISMIKLRK